MVSFERLIWFKGRLCQANEARVPVLSPTAQFGLNVFEGLRGYWNAERNDVFLFRVNDHLDRLFASCKLLGLAAPYEADEILAAIVAALRANAYRCDVAARVTIFVDGEGSWSQSDPVDMFVAPIAQARRDLSTKSAARACISTWERIDDRSLPPRVKAGANYINGRYAHLEAKAAGYDLPVLLDRRGKISEGAGACIMMVRDGVLVTPPTTSSLLESITRATLLDLAAEIGLSTQIREIDRTELYIADEVFLCGSAAELTPLGSVDRYQIGSGQIGAQTAKLLARYLEVASGSDPTRDAWCQPVWGATLPC